MEQRERKTEHNPFLYFIIALLFFFFFFTLMDALGKIHTDLSIIKTQVTINRTLDIIRTQNEK